MISEDDNGDRNIPLNTTENNHNTAPADHDIPYCSEFVPPESFWLSKDSEFDWFDRNAFLERKESTKGNSKTASYSRSNSQKFSVNLKSKPAIIGLPKTQRNTHVDSNRRQCKLATVRMFPKRSGSGGRTTVTEPSSPKVSCIGRVRSKRCASRRRAAQSTKPVTKPVNQTEKSQKTGIISKITALFRSDGQRRRKDNKSLMKVTVQTENSYSRKNNVTVKPVNSEPASPPDPPVLGGMNRFASGRRSVNWTDEIDVAGRRSTG
ncbi:putative calcium/calmodulin-dependent protein kinase [Helianthus annuus]|nr:putative calcium/calmodulin-dependent protein kinase [Helianthus annuus]KAJ0622064.1 putative calcium/calmodulin-dependent protein kinase [Helianthus annuus]KAJ0626392.1 putative calcium/calmodulin-dependent protein kinase [Helianthus annuus]KAJ0782735.1 putative calcium/calmodulin-dependent protein kinase [Helianthus annuus]KAJ0956345.1 putative calcium/calmodulin-dependent protein kinase [Helianthus annuus]